LNARKLVPDKEIHYGDKATVAKEAQALLRRVITDHPGAPWTLLAGRELKDSFGFRWVETYVKPIEKRDNAAEAKKKKEPPKPMEQPPELPKL